MGILDRIWPRRAQAAPPVIPKRTAAVIAATRNFEAALVDRLTASWKAPGLTANEEIHAALEPTRNRARDLAKNNEFAKKYLSTLVANIVGPTGFALQSLAAEADGKPDRLARTLIEAAFTDWSRRGMCEVTGRLSWVDVQALVAEAWGRDGEALIVQIKGKKAGNKYGYALRLVEVERLPVQYSRDLKNGAQIIMGVEVDDLNRTVAYWLNLGKLGTAASHGAQATLTRVDAADVIHVYKPYRPEQVRGMPSLHAVIRGLQMLDGYEEAAIVAARIGASKMGFFTTPDGEAPPGDDQDEQGNTITDADPGSFQTLPRGVQFQDWNPDYPHANYQAFMKTRLRSIASGMGVTYHGLANDLEGVNFSSIRSGTLEERDSWMMIQEWFSSSFLERVFAEWLPSALAFGQVTMVNGSALPMAKIDKFRPHSWQGRRWEWVDPLKDIEADIAAINAGLKSPQSVAAKLGLDYEDLLVEIQAAKALRDTLGVDIPSATKTPPP
jgi:lambda family phage portal protein